jgi:uncharacterized protein (TIGR02246 family)
MARPALALDRLFWYSTRMNRYAVTVLVVLLTATVCTEAQEKTHSPKKVSVEQRLRILEDKEEIRELLIAYGRDFDKRDFAAYARLFASDGVWSGGAPGARAYTGPEAIREFVTKTYPPSQYPGSYHVMSSLSVQILDENNATAWSRWTYIVLGVHGEPAPFAAGHYEDTLVREGGVWKFKRRTVFAEAKQP